MPELISRSIAEQTMNSMWENIESGAMDKSLERYRALGYSSLLNEYVLDPDSYFFPNISGSTITRPKSVSEDAIMVLPLKPGQHFLNKATLRLHPIQEASLLASGYTEELVGNWAKKLEEEDGEIYPSPGERAVASVLTALGNITLPDQTKAVIRAKPVVIFNATDKTHDTCPGAALHELVHVAQSLANPIAVTNSNLEHELEAYHVQAGLLYSSSDIGSSLSTLAAATVEHFRIRRLGTDTFIPTNEFIHDCTKDPIMNEVVNWA